MINGGLFGILQKNTLSLLTSVISFSVVVFQDQILLPVVQGFEMSSILIVVLSVAQLVIKLLSWFQIHLFVLCCVVLRVTHDVLNPHFFRPYLMSFYKI